MTEVFFASCDGALGVGVFWGNGVICLKVVPSDQSEFLHNFLIPQDPSLITLRIALSIRELHESEGNLHKRARIMEMLKL